MAFLRRTGHQEGDEVNTTRQQLTRSLVEAKRAMDAAFEAYQAAKNEYRLRESFYLKEWPIPGQKPGNVYCDPFFIAVKNEWQRADCEPRLHFQEAERCPTSE